MLHLEDETWNGCYRRTLHS